MKGLIKSTLAILPALFISTHVFAQKECQIAYITNQELDNMIIDRGLELEDYDKTCALLKAANATIDIQYAYQITPHQTSASASIRLLANEYLEQDVAVYSTADNWMTYDAERTSKAQKDVLYDVAMIGIDDIKQDAVDSLNEQRAKFKAYQVKQ